MISARRRNILKRRVVNSTKPYRSLESAEGAMRLLEAAQHYARSQVENSGKIPPHAIVFVRRDPHSKRWYDAPMAYGLEDTTAMFSTEFAKAMKEGDAVGALVACNIEISKNGEDRTGVMLRLVHKSLSLELAWLAQVKVDARGATLGPFEEYEPRDDLLLSFLNTGNA